MPKKDALTFKQLRALRAVADCGSMTQAGAELRLTPSAVHTQIRSLEAALNARVLVSSGASGARLTEEGEAVLRAERQIDSILQHCTDTVRSLRYGQSGVVTLGVVSTGKYFAPHLVAQLGKMHPKIDVVLRVGNREETLASINERAVELVVMGRPPRTPKLIAEPLGPHPHVLIAAPAHRLANSDAVLPEDLMRETFIMREQGSGTRIMTTRYLDQIGEGRAPRQIEMGSNETIKQAVMAGLGIAILSLHTVTEEIRAGRLATLAAPGLPIERQWFLLHREDTELSSAAATIRASIIELDGSFLPA